jgi:hypothetical protein
MLRYIFCKKRLWGVSVGLKSSLVVYAVVVTMLVSVIGVACGLVLVALSYRDVGLIVSLVFGLIGFVCIACSLYFGNTEFVL